MYSEVITLFNHHSDRLGDAWYPHLLTNVDLIVDRASVIAKYGPETSSSAKLHIKYDSDGNNLSINGIPYINPKEWHNLTTDERKEYITFNSDGINADFFVIGDAGYTEPIFDDASAQNSLIERISKEKDTYTIVTVSEPYKVIKHFEIMAKG